MANPKRKLGRGLDALIGASPYTEDNAPAPPGNGQASTLPDGTRLVAIDPRTVGRNPKQPRRVFDEEALQELADSIRRDGVQEPVVVRETADGYELISGERRVRASVMADLREVPAVVRDVADADLLRLGLIENIQREDLNAIETALAYQELMETQGWTQEDVAQQVGKKRATVANTLRLLKLPADVQALVANAQISMGHARAVLAVPTPDAQSALARKIIDGRLSVRQAEQLAGPKSSPEPEPSAAIPAAATPDAHIAALEEELRRRLGTKVRVQAKANGSGVIQVNYYSNEDLDRILGHLRESF